MKGIYENLRVIREKENLSQEEVAERMNKTQSSYARIERGATKIDLDTLANFAQAMKMDLIDVITFPKKFVDIEKISNNQIDPIRAIIQIELQKEKKDQVLKLIFGEENLELLSRS